MKTKVPHFKSAAEAEVFPEQDLSGLDFSQFKPSKFEFEKKTGRVNMRLPESLLCAVKRKATARKIPYRRFIREALEQAAAARKWSEPVRDRSRPFNPAGLRATRSPSGNVSRRWRRETQ